MCACASEVAAAAELLQRHMPECAPARRRLKLLLQWVALRVLQCSGSLPHVVYTLKHTVVRLCAAAALAGGAAAAEAVLQDPHQPVGKLHGQPQRRRRQGLLVGWRLRMLALHR